MATMKIYHGREKPYVAVGKHQCNLLDFAFRFPGWHVFAKDRTTRRAVDGLEKRGAIAVDRKFRMFCITHAANTKEKW